MKDTRPFNIAPVGNPNVLTHHVAPAERQMFMQFVDEFQNYVYHEQKRGYGSLSLAGDIADRSQTRLAMSDKYRQVHGIENVEFQRRLNHGHGPSRMCNNR